MGFQLAVLSIAVKGVRLLTAPLTLFLVGEYLSESELAFYFAFLSIVAAQQLLEAGMGHVIRQYVAHLDYGNRSKIQEYFGFALVWFGGLSLLILLLVGAGGHFYLESFGRSGVDWQKAWWCLVIGAALMNLTIPFQVVLEGAQKYLVVRWAQLFSALLSFIASIWVILGDAPLYSPGIALIVGAIFLNLLLVGPSLAIGAVIKSFISVFKEFWPLLSKVSIVWFFGYFFWNSFSLIAFAKLEAEEAGRIMLAVAVARAMMSVMESSTSGQMALYANLISKGSVRESYKRFTLYRNISGAILLMGYALVAMLASSGFLDLALLNKLPSFWVVISVFLFYCLVYVYVTQNNYIRCFKSEPFVWLSILNAMVIPLVFYLSVGEVDYFMFLVGLAFLPSVYWSRKVSARYVLRTTT